jgi:hypothetical protein
MTNFIGSGSVVVTIMRAEMIGENHAKFKEWTENVR